MGGGLTNQILSERMEVVSRTGELILQPQSEQFKVRQMLMDCNFIIVKENMVKEEGKFYVMMKAVPVNTVHKHQVYELTKKEHLYYGKLLLESQNDILKEFLLWDLEICEEIMNALENEQTDNALQRKIEMKERIDLNHISLEYYR